MRQFIFLVLGIALLAAGCNTHSGSNSSVKRDIPTYIGGRPDLFYELTKDRQNQLGLDSLDDGYHNLQVRVWYNHELSQEQNLVVIANKDSNWTATVYTFKVEQGGKIISKQIKQATPTSGWPAFSKKLLDLKIMTLLNQDDVEGYSAGKDGSTYTIEVATKDEYRLYSYWEPQKNQDKFWQAKNMTEIINLLDTELLL